MISFITAHGLPGLSHTLDSNSRILRIAFSVLIFPRPISETLEFCVNRQLDPLYLQSHL